MSLKCTKCGSTGLFRINGDASVWVTGNGEELDHTEGSNEYNGDYQAFCVSCGHDDSVRSFREFAMYQEEEAAKVAASVKAAQLVPKEDYDDLRERFKKMEKENEELKVELNKVRAQRTALDRILNDIKAKASAPHV